MADRAVGDAQLLGRSGEAVMASDALECREGVKRRQFSEHEERAIRSLTPRLSLIAARVELNFA
jgi:hypothetical protein